MTEQPTFSATLSSRVPDAAEVERIAALGDSIIRNLQITQCYHELSAAFTERTGAGANWCTFATWASKQAGQTIRKEDLARTLEAALNTKPVAEQAILKLVTSAKLIGAKHGDEKIRKSIWNALTGSAIDRTSDAVSKGNKKVFEEIGREFARFISTCLHDPAFDADNIQRFCDELRPGVPPDGQQYLRQAFTRYYQAFFEADNKKRAELLLLANLEIGFHEQNRLQPEIAASLDSTLIEPNEFRSRLIEAIFPARGWLTSVRLFFLRLFGRRSHFDKATESFVTFARQQLRLVITAHLLTITFPPDVRLRLGQDLAAEFPELLKELSNAELHTLLEQIDPTPDSLRESGAMDWADLPDRMHFIVDLFRCYQESKELFEAPFSSEQIIALKSGSVPGGQL